MDDHRQSAADGPSPSAVNLAASLATLGPDWDTEDAYWQSAYPERPYARADRSYEYYRTAYRYGAERATQWRTREWADVEHALRDGWPSFSEDRDAPWDEMRDAVRDAWDRVRGR